MAHANGWVEKHNGPAGSGRVAGRGAGRSLKDALSEAGLSDAGSSQAGMGDGADQKTSRRDPASPRGARIGVARTAVDAASELRTLLVTPRLSAFVEETPPVVDPDVAAVRSTPATSSVVSPPPWLRAARRGRREARLLNTFGWLMTIVVAGSIIGIAGRYLAVPPSGLEHMQSARQ